VTPAIGREFAADLQLSALLSAPNADALVRDLAVLVSRRGVVFFRGQDISPDDMMVLARRIGELSGRPAQSDMCIHPVSEYTPELVHTPKPQVISAERQNKGGGIRRIHDDVSRWASVAWHSDVSFENVPSDYSMLKVNILPEAGGDTLWVDAYGVLDRMSPSFVQYLETLTAEHNAEFFHKEAENLGLKVRDDIERGNPLNKGSTLVAHHPVIRTNRESGVEDADSSRDRVEGPVRQPRVHAAHRRRDEGRVRHVA
jgi:alpha-ketoglutarate-dependent taurine dioxygenase